MSGHFGSKCGSKATQKTYCHQLNLSQPLCWFLTLQSVVLWFSDAPGTLQRHFKWEKMFQCSGVERLTPSQFIVNKSCHSRFSLWCIGTTCSLWEAEILLRRVKVLILILLWKGLVETEKGFHLFIIFFLLFKFLVTSITSVLGWIVFLQIHILQY